MKQPEGDFPNDLSLLTFQQVKDWLEFWREETEKTIEPDKKHIYQHNWDRCATHLLRIKGNSK